MDEQVLVIVFGFVVVVVDEGVQCFVYCFVCCFLFGGICFGNVDGDQFVFMFCYDVIDIGCISEQFKVQFFFWVFLLGDDWQVEFEDVVKEMLFGGFKFGLVIDMCRIGKIWYYLIE